MSLREKFTYFLINYVSRGHTYIDDAMNELEQKTKEFVNSLYDEYLFCMDTVDLYCENMLCVMSEENKGFFHFVFNKNRYIQSLELEIKNDF